MDDFENISKEREDNNTLKRDDLLCVIWKTNAKLVLVKSIQSPSETGNLSFENFETAEREV